MLADRRAALEGFGMPLADDLALEASAGIDTFGDAVADAARFAGGEGRHGAGAGVCRTLRYRLWPPTVVGGEA